MLTASNHKISLSLLFFKGLLLLPSARTGLKKNPRIGPRTNQPQRKSVRRIVDVIKIAKDVVLPVAAVVQGMPSYY